VLSKQKVPVLVTNDALQTIEDQPVVFVNQNGEFVLRRVTVGGSNATHSEIRKGLAAGDGYVTRGAFILKAELAKGSGGHEH
jgi:cobalt-zinc-cadmium efflux system membrane fusion protein